MLDMVSIDKLTNKSKLQCKFLGKSYKTAVERFHAEENISEAYEVTLWLVSEDKIHFKDVIRQACLFSVEGKDNNRHFHGIVNHFMLSGKGGRFYFYQATLVPSLWFLSLGKNFRIFQNKSTEEIVTDILEENGIDSDCYTSRLIKDYEERRYCTQYGESDLHFISRLLEEEGIFYFFEHSPDNHLLVLADDTVVYKRIEGETEIGLHHDAGMAAEKEVIDKFGYVRSIRPGKVTHTNYNFKRPSLDLHAEALGDTHERYEIYQYPGAHGLPEQGERNAQIHLEEQKTLEETAQGTSNCPRFRPGFTFDMTCHDFEDLNTKYLLVSVEHKGSQSHVTGEYSGIGGDFSYSNEFLAIPASVTLRPEKTFQKPSVLGLQSAVVTGPPGQEIHTDEYGRIKVQFHWDREGQNNGRSSCWLRTSQPWSGNGWGMVSLPRIGDEVLVAFLNGDPDWPIMVGNLNNAASPALYSLPANRTQSGIRTRSTPGGGPNNFNELRFEDKKGSEEVYLQGEKDWNILVKNDKAQQVGRDEALQVGNNRVKTVGLDQMEHVGRNHTEVIGVNKSISIGCNKTETVDINSTENVGLAKELTVGGIYQVSVAGAMNETVLGAKTEEVGITKAVMVGSHMTERVMGNRALTVGENLSATVRQNVSLKAKSIIFEGDDEIVLKCGSASISLKSNGEIVLKGVTFTEKASGEIVIKGSRTSVN